ncbi:MAG: hypothetical protein WAT79_08690 [Saprospiraceae bacterium]
MGKNKIIKKQWKRIEKLEKELADRCKDVENLIENPEGLGSIEAKFNYNTRKQFNNYNLVAGRQPDLNKMGAGLYDHLVKKEVKLHKDFLGLPENWYIQVTKDNKEILTDYLKNHKQRYEQFSEHWYIDILTTDDEPGFFHSDSKDAAHTIPVPMGGYTEVTIEMVENYMKKWHKIQDIQNRNVVVKGVSFGTFSGEEYKFPKEEMESREYHVSKHAPVNMFDDKYQSWIDFKKREAKNVGDQLAAQNDVNKDGSLPPFAITQENLTPISKHVRDITESGTHKAPEKWIKVLVKEGSIIITPDVKGISMVKAMPTQDPIRVGDLSKCVDQECKPIKQQYEKTLENVTKIYSFIGLREKNSISKGNKDIIFMKTNNYNGGVGYFNTKEPNLMYSPSEMLSDWKSNYVKPLD